MRNSGFIYKDDKFYYVSYNKEQRLEFHNLNKVYVHVFYDELLQNPVLNEKQAPKAVLKNINTLTFIGFND